MDHPVSLKKSEAPGHQRKQWVCKSKSSTNDEAEQNMEKGIEKVVVEQDKVQGKKTETRAEAGASL
jgi:hypothetical protein